LAAPDVTSASTSVRMLAVARGLAPGIDWSEGRRVLCRSRVESSSMLSSANKDCSSFLTSAQRQHRCGEGAHAVAVVHVG
jgi:hypothetical protein